MEQFVYPMLKRCYIHGNFVSENDGSSIRCCSFGSSFEFDWYVCVCISLDNPPLCTFCPQKTKVGEYDPTFYAQQASAAIKTVLD